MMAQTCLNEHFFPIRKEIILGLRPHPLYHLSLTIKSQCVWLYTTCDGVYPALNSSLPVGICLRPAHTFPPPTRCSCLTAHTCPSTCTPRLWLAVWEPAVNPNACVCLLPVWPEGTPFPDSHKGAVWATQLVSALETDPQRHRIAPPETGAGSPSLWRNSSFPGGRNFSICLVSVLLGLDLPMLLGP